MSCECVGGAGGRGLSEQDAACWGRAAVILHGTCIMRPLPSRAHFQACARPFPAHLLSPHIPHPRHQPPNNSHPPTPRPPPRCAGPAALPADAHPEQGSKLTRRQLQVRTLVSRVFQAAAPTAGVDMELVVGCEEMQLMHGSGKAA